MQLYFCPAFIPACAITMQNGKGISPRKLRVALAVGYEYCCQCGFPYFQPHLTDGLCHSCGIEVRLQTHDQFFFRDFTGTKGVAGDTPSESSGDSHLREVDEIEASPLDLGAQDVAEDSSGHSRVCDANASAARSSSDWRNCASIALAVNECESPQECDLPTDTPWIRRCWFRFKYGVVAQEEERRRFGTVHEYQLWPYSYDHPDTD